nr:hypothetical protein [Burkholderia glumae]
MVPLEALRVPAALDGSAGLNRAPVPAHQAEMNTDLQAVNAWIAIRGARSAQTQRAYRREAERLLLWAIVAKGKPLSSLNTLDVAEYLEQFLANPQPAERWIGRGGVERFDLAWRPFAGPLSARSRDTARRILTAMGAWLVRQQYLRVNPFEGLAAAAPVPIDTAGRTLTHAQWRYVLQTVWQPGPCSAPSRDRSDAARRPDSAAARRLRAAARLCDGPAARGAGRGHHRRPVAQGARRRARETPTCCARGRQEPAPARGADAGPAALLLFGLVGLLLAAVGEAAAWYAFLRHEGMVEAAKGRRPCPRRCTSDGSHDGEPAVRRRDALRAHRYHPEAHRSERPGLPDAAYARDPQSHSDGPIEQASAGSRHV